MAEIEFSLLSRQCLRDRMGDRANLTDEVGAWGSQPKFIRVNDELAIYNRGYKDKIEAPLSNNLTWTVY